MTDKLIIGFEFPHKVGSVCRFPCEQCHDRPDSDPVLYLLDGPVDIIPLCIIREATREEHYMFYISNGGDPFSILSPEIKYFYEVTTD